MALLLRLGTPRSLSRPRDGPAALAGLRSSAVAPWAAIRESSSLSPDEFASKIVDESQESPQGKTDSSSHSSTHVDPNSTQTQSAEPRPPPSVSIKKVPVTFRKPRTVPVDRPSWEPPRNEATEQLVRRVRPADPLVQKIPDSLIRKFPASEKDPLLRKISESLIRKFPVSGENYSNARQLGIDKPSAVFSRPRVVVLRNLPPETAGRDIIEALEKAVDSKRLPHRAWRVADVRVEPGSGDDKLSTARVIFLHPDGARAVHDLVSLGYFQVRGVAPTSSLLQTAATPKVSGDVALGAPGSNKDRREYFASVHRKIVRRTHLIYN